ncbi:MAG: hypothetical protein ACRDZ4_15740 [Egibacteraceae bacterium]
MQALAIVIVGYRHLGPDTAILFVAPRAWARRLAAALVASALTICERSKLHTAVMLLSDALNVLKEGDDDLT